MARIRTIKPEFFTSEDIVSLSPLARLFYVSLWCEADREGRLSWRPKTLKFRYFPADECDVDTVATELTDAGLVILYEVDGAMYAEIPTFARHQVINNRESQSVLPSRVFDASKQRKSGDQGEGKEGKERKGTRVASLDDVPPGFAEFWKTWPTNDRKQAKGKCLDAWKKANAEIETAVIIDHVESLKNSESWRKQSGAFIPAPLVYLNNRRWEGAESVQSGSSGNLGMFV